MQTNRNSRRWVCWFAGILLTLVVIWLAAAGYFFKVAMVPGHKSFINQPVSLKKSDPLYAEKKWFEDAHKKQWVMMAANGHDRLVADYLPAATPSKRSVLIAHGYMNDKEQMGAYAALFHQMGYNVLMPDARAHGQSQGKFIGYGWPERYDARKWLNRLIKKNGPDSQVVMFGVSMGGATTMMTAGLKLPPQVKALVEDCGYDSVQAEFYHEAHELYHLPLWLAIPLVKTMSGINRVANGFFIGQASAANSLHHNHLPLLVIHGKDDTFVPTAMAQVNYRATRGPKELWLVPGAVHAKSFATAPTAYRDHVQNFLRRYMK